MMPWSCIGRHWKSTIRLCGKKHEENLESIRQEKHQLLEYVQELSIKLGTKQKPEEKDETIRSMHSEIASLNTSLDRTGKILREMGSKLSRRALF
jgi:peptidoglycan hydrolase CwlO-like protein